MSIRSSLVHAALLVFAAAAGSLFAQAPPPVQQAAQRIKTTVHNLSSTGPGVVRAATETEICLFCHTPHGSNTEGPLWNRSIPAGRYLIYKSSSLKAKPGQPTGSSKLCLSCHDGTIALGSVLSRAAPIVMAGPDRIPAGHSNLGTDLTDDHPISFAYSSSTVGSSTELVPAEAIIPPVHLDPNGEVQCTSCHEPHDNSFGKFLVRPDDQSALCRSCHRPDSWDSSIHATSGAVLSATAAGLLGAPTVAVSQNACKDCHRAHGSPGRPWLLAREHISRTCDTCHEGTVAQRSIRTELQKVSNHGVVIDASPIPDSAGTPYSEGTRVSCSDCHNAHAAGSSDGLAAGVPASLARVSGVGLNGSPKESLSSVEELCFRCHGDAYATTVVPVNRQIVQLNVRLQFQTGNPSYHPVANPGVNSQVPSLIAPWTTGSRIGCQDCHDADDTRRLGGTGPAGPHGSIYPPLLARRYDTTDFSVESTSAYDLCYRCHQRSSILGNRSFKEHEKHIVEERTPCSVCHDPHGIYSGQGTARNNSNLINFDRAVVFPNSLGRLEFIDTGTFRGTCNLHCHGEDHINLTYSP